MMEPDLNVIAADIEFAVSDFAYMPNVQNECIGLDDNSDGANLSVSRVPFSMLIIL